MYHNVTFKVYPEEYVPAALAELDLNVPRVGHSELKLVKIVFGSGRIRGELYNVMINAMCEFDNVIFPSGYLMDNDVLINNKLIWEDTSYKGDLSKGLMSTYIGDHIPHDGAIPHIRGKSKGKRSLQEANYRGIYNNRNMFDMLFRSITQSTVKDTLYYNDCGHDLIEKCLERIDRHLLRSTLGVSKMDEVDDSMIMATLSALETAVIWVAGKLMYRMYETLAKNKNSADSSFDTILFSLNDRGLVYGIGVDVDFLSVGNVCIDTGGSGVPGLFYDGDGSTFETKDGLPFRYIWSSLKDYCRLNSVYMRGS